MNPYRPSTLFAVMVTNFILDQTEDGYGAILCRMKSFVFGNCRLHGSSLKDIRQKPSMGELLEQGTFERLILLDSREGPGHVQCIWDGRSRVLYEDGTVSKEL